MSYPSSVPVSADTSPGQSGITFTLSPSSNPNDPLAIEFGSQATPLAVSKLEIPSRLASLGGVQNHAVHLFPGGYKTVQALGAFPHALQWSGTLLGGNASPRSFQLDTLRRSGKTAYLSAGPWQWEGLVTSYLADFLHQNYITYEMNFEPTVDLTATQPASQVDQGPQMNALLQQINSAYLSSESVLSLLAQAALRAFANTVTALITQGPPYSSAQILAIEQAQASADVILASDQASLDTQIANQALGAAAAVDALAGGLLVVPTSNMLVGVINPNLAMLASQYLSDAARWPEIAALNGLTDIEPAGLFNLQIP